MYKTLGMNLVLSDPPEECRMQVLNEVWKTVKNLKEPNVGNFEKIFCLLEFF